MKASLGGVADLPRTGVYSWKCKECEVFLLTDISSTNTSHKTSHKSNSSSISSNAQKNAVNVVHEAVVWKLITGGGAVTPFLGMQVETLDKKITGTIVSSYGADGESVFYLFLSVCVLCHQFFIFSSGTIQNFITSISFAIAVYPP